MKKFVIALSFLVTLLIPTTALAYNPLGAACNAGTNTSAACNTTGTDPVSGSNGLIARVANVIAVVAGIAAVIIIIVGGINYMTSDGDPQKVNSARSTILGAIIGLIVIAVARGVIQFVVSKL